MRRGFEMESRGPAIEVPIHSDEHGTLRIANTRVALDIVIARFQQGATPEQINESFPSLKRGDIYAVISYYLQNQNEVDAYLRQQDDAAEQVRHELQATRPEMFEFEAQLRERANKRD